VRRVDRRVHHPDLPRAEGPAARRHRPVAGPRRLLPGAVPLGRPARPTRCSSSSPPRCSATASPASSPSAACSRRGRSGSRSARS
jgi:hypothetical protein